MTPGPAIGQRCRARTRDPGQAMPRRAAPSIGALLFAIGLALLGSAGCRGAPAPPGHPSPACQAAEERDMRRFSHRAMGSIFEVFIPEGQADAARDAAEAAFQELDRLEKLLSHFNPYSDVGQINGKTS